MKLANAVEMQQIDTIAIDRYRIPGMILMENAGLATVRMMDKELDSAKGKGAFALIFVGPGNNGGDGLVIGRHLHQIGCEPHFVFLADPDSLTGDAALNMEIIRKLQFPFHIINADNSIETLATLHLQLVSEKKPCYAIVDAIFGIGLARDVTGYYGECIDFINDFSKWYAIPVIAVDIPSGLDSNTGKVLGKCVHAHTTATYSYAKPGHYLLDGPKCSGKIQVLDIGIPKQVLKHVALTTELLTNKTTSKTISCLKRDATAHKGSNGHLAVLAGSLGKTGAAALVVKGALRTGAGLVSLFAPKKCNVIYETLLIEAMTVPLPFSISSLHSDDLIFIREQLKNKDAVVLGPGIGTESATEELVMSLYESVQVPMVLDADALSCLARHREHLPNPAGSRILTPHPGEMARLLGCSTQEIQENRVQATQEACTIYGCNDIDCVVLLKGCNTIVATSSGALCVNSSGNPGMSTGGMGDVLSGIIASLLTQGLAPEQATTAGVYIHGMAGDLLYGVNSFGYTASELADCIPDCLSALMNIQR